MMFHVIIRQFLNMIELRERRLIERIGELAGRLCKAEGQREAPATTAKTVRDMAADLDLQTLFRRA